MKVGVFVPRNNQMHVDMLLAFAKGVRNVGEDVTLYDVNDYHPVDIAVVFGIGKKNVPISFPRGHVITSQLTQEKDVIIIERGFVQREDYFMVGFNGLNNRADFKLDVAHQSDRWGALGVKLKPFQNKGENIVVCGQVPSDASVQNVDIIKWCAETCTSLRQRTSKTVVFRPHPLALNRTPAMLGVVNSPNQYLKEDLADAMVCVTYNSNAAVEAIIEGVPAMSFDPGSMAWDITSHELAYVEKPFFPSDAIRQQWANNLAYTQWNKDEFESGLPWLHLTRDLIQRRAS